MDTKPIAYRVITAYKSPYPNPILFRKGEIVELSGEFHGDPDWVDWVWCVGQNENSAWTPKQFIEFEGSDWRLNRDYNALELSVDLGEILSITEIVNGFGLAEKYDGTIGWVPMKNLQCADEGR